MLQVIPDHVFDNLRTLSTLLLDHNTLLRHISTAAFVGLVKLEELRLDHGRLETLDSETLAWTGRPIRPRIYLAGNPWTCDCNLRWLLRMITKQEEQLSHHELGLNPDHHNDPLFVDNQYIVCSSPSSLRNHRLQDLRHHQMACLNHDSPILSKRRVDLKIDQIAMLATMGTFLGIISLSLMLSLAHKLYYWRAEHLESCGGSRGVRRALITLILHQWFTGTNYNVIDSSVLLINQHDQTLDRTINDNSPCVI